MGARTRDRITPEGQRFFRDTPLIPVLGRQRQVDF